MDPWLYIDLPQSSACFESLYGMIFSSRSLGPEVISLLICPGKYPAIRNQLICSIGKMYQFVIGCHAIYHNMQFIVVSICHMVGKMSFEFI